MTVKFYGASDDLIEVDGDISEEFSYVDEDEDNYLAFSDGTLVRVQYGHDGIWHINTVARGSATLTITEAVDADSDQYSDIGVLEGDVAWVLHGMSYAEARTRA